MRLRTGLPLLTYLLKTIIASSQGFLTTFGAMPKKDRAPGFDQRPFTESK